MKHLNRRLLLGVMATVFATGLAEARTTGGIGTASATLGLPTTMTLVNTSGSTQAANFITPVFGHSFRKGDVPPKAVYTASVSGTTMTVSAITSGTIAVGDLVICNFTSGNSVGPWCYITALGTGSGGTGTYTLSNSNTVSSTTMWSAGTPQFTISGTAQPLSWGCQNFWSDYSLKHASFAFRCGSSIVGSGSVTVTVTSGGTTPATSARSLASDVYPQNLQVNIVGVVGLSGIYTGVVASHALNVQQAVYLDGAAGKWWRIHTRAGQGGTAHGQVEVYHYVGALTDGSGNLGGFRYVPRVCQPWYNVNSPTQIPIAANLSWQYGSGPTTVSWNWPFSTVNFTTTSSAVCTMASSGTHNFYQGAIEGGINAVPGVFSVSGGALDTALSANTIYWATNLNPSNSPANNTQFYVQATPGLTSQIVMQGNATGTMTFTPTQHILPNESIFDLDNEGQAKFFQGTGSLSADQTVMTQFNCAYLVSTGLTQPFDTTYTGTAFGGTIQDNSQVLPAGWNYNWNPCTVGPIGLSDIGEAGEHDYLGPVTQYTARHFYNQSALSARIVRMQATASEFFGVSSFRDSVSGNYINTSSNTYHGIIAPSGALKSIMSINGTVYNVSGVTPPPAHTNIFCMGEANHAHQPNLAFWAGLVFADPHFVDLAIESGIGSVTMFGQSIRNPSSPLPAGTGIVVNQGNGGTRELAWALREIIHGAIVAPNTHPDGSQSCDMVRDSANNNLNYMNSMCTSALLGSYFYTNGRWNSYAVPANQASPCFGNDSTGFGCGYLLNVVPLGVSALENSNALSLLNFWSGWWQHVMNTFSGYWMYGESDFAVFQASNANALGPIRNDNYFAIQVGSLGPGLISWTDAGGGPYFTLNADGAPAWVPKNGDLWMWGNDETVPGGFTAGNTNTQYYIRDWNPSTLAFNLALTVSGPAIVPTNTGSVAPEGGAGGGNSGPFTMSVLPSWAVASNGYAPAGGAFSYNGYCTIKHAGWSFCKAVGATGYDVVGSAGTSLIGDAATRMSINRTSFTEGPTYLAATSL